MSESGTKPIKTAVLATESAATGRLLKSLGLFCLALGTPSAVVGFALDDPVHLALSAALLGLAVVLGDISRAQHGAVTPITLYAFSWALTSAANLLGILNQDTSDRRLFFLYAVDEHLPVAAKLSWLGVVIPILAFKFFNSSPTLSSLARALPSVAARLSQSRILRGGIAAAAVGFMVTMTPWLRSLGTLYALLGFLPHLVAFVLARIGVARRYASYVWIALAIALLEAGRAALFAYLRTDVVSPIVAYAAGVMVGARSLRALRSPFMVPVYVGAVVFVAYFAAFGEARSRTSAGVERLVVVDETRAVREYEGQQSYWPLIARLSNFNQITQVARVVEEDGYYSGGTLEYLAFAWIPRFIWPEKPLIAKGAWFAHRIGQAHIRGGRITNSINMTIPGELYLNFGWTGTVVGLSMFGGLLALLWLTTSFWSDPGNVMGGAFGFYLIWTGLLGGADLQIVVTLIATYLVFAAVAMFFRASTRRTQLPHRRLSHQPAS